MKTKTTALIAAIIAAVAFGCDVHIDTAVSSARQSAPGNPPTAVGQVWIERTGNPFSDSSADTNTVLNVERGWVKYQNEYTYKGQFFSVTRSSTDWMFRCGSTLR